MIKIILLTLLTLSSIYANAGLTPGSHLVGGGLLYLNTNKTTISDDASISFIGPMYLPVHYQMVSNFFGSSGYTWAPGVTYSLLSREATDAAANTHVMLLRFPFVKNGSGNLYYLYGPGIMLYQIFGKGGSATLNNGTGYQTFALPKRNQTSKNLILELGVGYNSGSKLHYSLNMFLTSPLSSRISSNFMFNMSYKL